MNSFLCYKKVDVDSLCVFQNINKTTLLQEAKYFDAIPFDTQKCICILTKLIYLINQGEILENQEATNIFFATTKLFQSKDVKLRHLLYLCIKELSSVAQNKIIATSSLIKDVTGREVYWAAAIRALCTITDSTTVQGIDRYMKWAIVDKNPAVSSAALVSMLHFLDSGPDLVRRCLHEAQGAIMSDNAMVSYHAFGVVAAAKSIDRLATVKLVTKLIQSSLRSPYSLCLLIRHAAKLANEDETETCKLYLEFIESCLHHKSEIVTYEAAHAMVNLKKSPKDLSQVVSILQMLCNSPKSTFRLAGGRTLATLTIKNPNSVAAAGVDLEKMISDPNRSIATLAITTLLITGAESSINRLLTQIVGFLSEISDDFKINIVQAIESLFTKYPRKHQSIAVFLVKMLRGDGGIQYKAAIVEVLIVLVEENQEAKETGLTHLCEFIEDFEHSPLTIRILHVLGREGPKTSQPSRYIRFIYNRILLESGPVRAAAVSTLAVFGATCEGLLPDIRVLLARCHLDDEDEVRERAIFFNQILDSGDRQLINDYIVNIRVPNPLILEKYLREHLATTPDAPFDISTVPVNVPFLEATVPRTLIEQYISREELYADQLKVVPGFEKLGRLLKTCMPLDLTEPETEYRVSYIKHIFPRHLILQFDCLNTLNQQFLEKVYVNLEIAHYYKSLTDVACEQLIYGKQGSAFCLLQFPEIPIETLCSMKATMEFVVRDCNPKTGLPDRAVGYADSYRLEKVVIGCPEQFRNRAASDDWEEVWIRASAASEVVDSFALKHIDITEGAEAVCEVVGLPITAIFGDAVKEIKGGGIFREGTPMLIRAKLEAAEDGDVTMFFSCRSPRVEVATLVVGAVAT